MSYGYVEQMLELLTSAYARDDIQNVRQERPPVTNIGKLFRDQFADAMQRNGNDLDKTINGWAGEVAKAKEVTEEAAEKQAP